MIKRFTIYCIYSFIISALCGYAAEASEAVISSRELIDKAAAFDGKKITYKGEAVTAIMKRGDFSWLTVNDGANSIGVWCNSDLIEEIKYVGEYQIKGDMVEITGIFNRACKEHMGDTDIHAITLRVVENGFRVVEAFDINRLYISLATMSVVFWLVLIFRRRV